MRDVPDNRIHPTAGFSLVELLVVVALIAALAGGIGLALGDAGGNSLATAQKTVATMVGAARTQAAISQQETILAIYGTRPPVQDAADRYMRLMQVFRNENTGTTPARWVAVGNPISLPRGVYVVPTTTTGLLAAGVTWPTNPPLTSTLRGPIALGQPVGTPFGGASMAFVVDFMPDGSIPQIGTLPHLRLVVATAALSTQNLPQFNNSNSVRGILIRPSGAVSFANEALGF